MDDGTCSVTSATDLLDSYLDKQLTNHLAPPLPTPEESAAGSLVEDADSEESYERLAELKSRCTLLHPDLPPSARFDHESAELLRKLARLKAKCHRVLLHDRPPIASLPPTDAASQTRTRTRPGVGDRLGAIRQAVESDLSERRWEKFYDEAQWRPEVAPVIEPPPATISAEDIRVKYPYLFPHFDLKARLSDMQPCMSWQKSARFND